MIIHALHGGGAERVTAQLAGHWAENGHPVTLITLDAVATDRYPVDPRVQRVGLDLMGAARNRPLAALQNLRRVRRLRQAIQDAKPLCVVSATDRMNVMSLLACRRLPVPVVIAEHNDPRHQPLPPVWEWLRGRTYRNAAVAVALTQDIANYIETRWRVSNTIVIPNGVALPGPESGAVNEPRDPTILAIGRLAAQKGFDLLIDAFSRVAANWPHWRLRILGEGPERSALEAAITARQLGERIELVGWVDDPHAELSRASVFVLSSRYEGFPVSLLEAMASGVPVVSFDCQSGPAEIIRDGVDGLLVPTGDIEALTAAIEVLLGDPTLRAELGHRAREVNQRFSLQSCFARWDAVLDGVVRE